VLEKELASYAANRDRLVTQANGQFVLVRGALDVKQRPPSCSI
jgi:hypothetical protein